MKKRNANVQFRNQYKDVFFFVFGHIENNGLVRSGVFQRQCAWDSWIFGRHLTETEEDLVLECFDLICRLYRVIFFGLDEEKIRTCFSSQKAITKNTLCTVCRLCSFDNFFSRRRCIVTKVFFILFLSPPFVSVFFDNVLLSPSAHIKSADILYILVIQYVFVLKIKKWLLQWICTPTPRHK